MNTATVAPPTAVVSLIECARLTPVFAGSGSGSPRRYYHHEHLLGKDGGDSIPCLE